MKLFHHFHGLTHHRQTHSDFFLFELSVWLHVFARALIVVFIPILLLQIGYTLSQVMLYYFVYCLIDVPLNWLARWMTYRFGARAVVTLGTLASIGFFGILFYLGPEQWLLLGLLALCSALYDTLYWVSHIYLFMEVSKKRTSAAKDTSLMSIARRFGSLMAPAFGAFVLIFFSDRALIVFSILILLSSIVPLLRASHIPDKPTKPPLRFSRFFRSWADIKHYILTSLYGVHGSAENVLWPVFIYLTFGSIESVAAIPILVSLAAIFFTYLAGNLNAKRRRLGLVVGSLLMAMVWILRLTLDLPWYYYASIFLVGVLSVFVTIPMESSIYERGEKRDPLSASMYRNAFAMAPKALLYGSLALLLHVFDVGFIAATISMLALALTATWVGSAKASA